jgi:hypothetical protein
MMKLSYMIGESVVRFVERVSDPPRSQRSRKSEEFLDPELAGE